jgi:mutator protein MutT
LSPDSPRPVVHVVAAAVIDAAERVLIAQRPNGTHLAGGWEFPGGKLESGEDRAAGLARELREEIGIAIASPRPLIRVRHAYPSREVLLDMWVVRHYDGEPRGLEGQALRWCTQDELAIVKLLPADKPIVAALRLPERLWEAVTPYYAVGDWGSSAAPAVGAEGSLGNRLRGVLCESAAEAAAAARAGANFLVLIEPLSPGELAALCRSIDVPIYAPKIALEEAWALGVSGVSELGR